MDHNIDFQREWCMPSENTFDITPIRSLVQEEVRDSTGVWLDPFCGGSDIADITNDLNPKIDADYNIDAVEFLQTFNEGEVDGGVLFDPPYSPRQIKEVYDNVGLETTMETTQANFWTDAKAEIERVCHSGATAITCGWNSGGIGKGRGFQTRRILLVAHGGWHNDTIVTVEDRVRTNLNEYRVATATDGGEEL